MKITFIKISFLRRKVNISSKKDLPIHLEVHRTVFDGYDDIPDDDSSGVSIGDLNARCNSITCNATHRRRSDTPQGCQP